MSSLAARDRAEEESYDWILAMDPLTGQPQPAARPDFLEEAQVGAIAAAEAYDDFAAAGMKKVMDIVAARKKSGGKFAMSTDACRTCSYLAVLLHYVDADFQLKELCAGVLPIVGRKDYALYGEKLQYILERVGAELNDVLTVVSDHDVLLRKAINNVLQLPAIGCQCHGLQLPVKHVMPPKEPRTPCARAAAPAPGVAAADPHPCSSSDSSSESSSTSQEEDAAREAQGAAQLGAERYPQLGLTDPERVKLIEDLTPYASRSS